MGGAIFKGNALEMRLVNVMVLGDENRNRLYKMTTIVGSFRTRWVTTSVLFNTIASTSDKISYMNNFTLAGWPGTMVENRRPVNNKSYNGSQSLLYHPRQKFI